jgi:hypothetical protein
MKIDEVVMNEELEVVTAYLSIYVGEKTVKGTFGLLIKSRFQWETFQVLCTNANHYVCLTHVCCMSLYPVLIHSRCKCLLQAKKSTSIYMKTNR